MRMSPDSRWGVISAMVWSTTAAGIISQMARGLESLLTMSASEEAPTAFAFSRSWTACDERSNTTLV